MTRPFKTVLAAVAIVAAAPALAQATVGKPAPAFSATDSNGGTVSLAGHKGKTVVLEWHNPECPFVKKHYDSDNMQQMQADAKAKGIVWLTINSGAPGKQGHLTGQQANAKIRDLGATPAAYGAKTTPHMYVINPKGTLVFAGGIDDIQSADPADIPKSKNFVTSALADLAAGKAVAAPTSRPYGCSVKY